MFTSGLTWWFEILKCYEHINNWIMLFCRWSRYSLIGHVIKKALAQCYDLVCSLLAKLYRHLAAHLEGKSKLQGIVLLGNRPSWHLGGLQHPGWEPMTALVSCISSKVYKNKGYTIETFFCCFLGDKCSSLFHHQRRQGRHGRQQRGVLHATARQ